MLFRRWRVHGWVDLFKTSCLFPFFQKHITLWGFFVHLPVRRYLCGCPCPLIHNNISAPQLTCFFFLATLTPPLLSLSGRLSKWVFEREESQSEIRLSHLEEIFFYCQFHLKPKLFEEIERHKDQKLLFWLAFNLKFQHSLELTEFCNRYLSHWLINYSKNNHPIFFPIQFNSIQSNSIQPNLDGVR